MGRRLNAILLGLAYLVAAVEERIHPPHLRSPRQEPTLERLQDGSDLVLSLPDEAPHPEPPRHYVMSLDPGAYTLSGHDARLRYSGDPTS